MHCAIRAALVCAVIAASVLPVLSAGVITPAGAATIEFAGSTGQPGLAVVEQGVDGVTLHFEIGQVAMEPLEISGRLYQTVSMPQSFLPNDAGAPDLPGIGRFVAIPRGSAARVEILGARSETFQDVRVAPAPVIPRENDDSPLVYRENAAIYGQDTAYPVSPIVLSEETGQLRGVDHVMLGVTPFAWNPLTRELKVYTELDVRIAFEGGTGEFGETRLRSRWWEALLAEHLVNYASLPPVDFEARLLEAAAGDRNGWEYIIITPDHPDFIAWGDTLKAWRKQEGISTECFTTTEVGGTSSYAIESFLDNAYASWDPAPAAFLLLGDYPNSGDRDSGITAPTYSYTYTCVSDNIYADVDGDDLPDMFHGRITARNAAELETMIEKMLDYERTPYTDPAFYDHPVIAGGWQTERWFILCTEICLGHQELVLGKNPVREYAIYSGTPGSAWSSNSNTSIVVNYFGPGGLGYIPSTPANLTDWGGNAMRINNDLNTGAYMMLHRDHGSVTGWGEPSYSTGSLSGLHNDMYPFVFSINCLTGKYNASSECFTERFHRMGQGAVGLIAASETSYSFVNDTFIWGMWDGMWPEFMPDYGPYDPPSRFATDLRPAMGMANGKYFLEASSWPYNPQNKDETYHLFHHHGDTFLRMFSEVPTQLAVNHAGVLFVGASSYSAQADAGAVIALTVDGEIIGVAQATGMPQEIPIVPQMAPGELRVVVTKANHYRYDHVVPITATGPYLVYDSSVVHDAGGDGDGVLDAAEDDGLSIVLYNVGTEITTGISGTLTTDDLYTTITTATQAFPNIVGGATGMSVAPFELELDPNTPDGHDVPFMLVATANEGQWECHFTLPVQAPLLEPSGYALDDSPPAGNGDGGADPGERCGFAFEVANNGHSATTALTATLSCAVPEVVIHGGSGNCPAVPPAGEGMLTGFDVEFLPSCPSPSDVVFELELVALDGYATTIEYEVHVGPWFDDCEEDLGWTLGVAGDNATTGVWVREDPVGSYAGSNIVQPEDDHTPDPGHICFVTANALPGHIATYADVDNGKTTLLSPVFDLDNAVSASISYWRWYTNDRGSYPGEDWWSVEASADGVTWVPLEHTQASATEWTLHEFDLGAYVPFTNHFQVRFVASDEGGESLVEAAVDDFIFDVVRQSSAGLGDGEEPVDVEAVRAHNGIVAISPNPFNPSTVITYRVGQRGPAALTIYDVSGRMVRTLLETVVEAGEHTLQFDGRGSDGQPLASGIYFLRLETPVSLQVRQLTLVK